MKKTFIKKPVLNRAPNTTYTFDGTIRNYLDNVTEQWLKVAPYANPAMIEMFRDRDRMPRRDFLPWSGEFAGKYLTSAVQVYRLTHDESLKEVIEDFVQQLIAVQAEDGYLGPFPKDSRLTGYAPNAGEKSGGTWDAWGHYHAMLGMLLWYEETGERKVFNCVKKIADLFCQKFLNGDKRLVDIGSTEMNLAPIHSLCLFYKKTGIQKYLDLAKKIADDFAAQGPNGSLAGDYIRTALEGREFFQTPRPRWESLHPIMGIAELYYITGDEKYRQAFEQIWWSIVKLDRHNNGGFSSGEQAQGNPYHQGAIETCCTIAWTAMSVEMLKLTGNSIVADEIELSTLNSIIGFTSASGRWVTYDTPMDGVRRASAHSIVFQAREGSPELNCCSVNGPRGFGMISDWALMTDGDGLTLNYYGSSKFKTALKSGVTVELEQITEYPVKGNIRVKVNTSRKAVFNLNLRIPYWSQKSEVYINSKTIKNVNAGSYCKIEREWKRGDIIKINLDMSPHYWLGEKECEGKASMYLGPILMTYDRRFNEMDPEDIPALDAAKLKGKLLKWDGWIPPMLLVEYTAQDGRKLRLCDFGSAGEGGTPYKSWLKIANLKKAGFSRQNPLRTSR